MQSRAMTACIDRTVALLGGAIPGFFLLFIFLLFPRYLLHGDSAHALVYSPESGESLSLVISLAALFQKG